MHHLLDVALLLVDGLVLLKFKPYLERAIRMAFSARAMRFITIFKVTPCADDRLAKVLGRL